MPVGDALAGAVVLFQAVHVLVVGAVDGLDAQLQADARDRRRHQIAHQVFAVAGDGVTVDGADGQRRDAHCRGIERDRPQGGVGLQSGPVGGRVVEADAFRAAGHQQGVVGAAVDGPLDAALDLAEVEHHRLRVEGALKHQVDDPAFAHQATLQVQIGAVNDGEVVDKQGGHGARGAIQVEAGH